MSDNEAMVVLDHDQTSCSLKQPDDTLKDCHKKTNSTITCTHSQNTSRYSNTKMAQLKVHEEVTLGFVNRKKVSLILAGIRTSRDVRLSTPLILRKSSSSFYVY